ncbi:MAG: hypothetical protein R2710_01960 [Acidimicrobiales bacterium]
MTSGSVLDLDVVEIGDRASMSCSKSSLKESSVSKLSSIELSCWKESSIVVSTSTSTSVSMLPESLTELSSTNVCSKLSSLNESLIELSMSVSLSWVALLPPPKASWVSPSPPMSAHLEVDHVARTEAGVDVVRVLDGLVPVADHGVAVDVDVGVDVAVADGVVPLAVDVVDRVAVADHGPVGIAVGDDARVRAGVDHTVVAPSKATAPSPVAMLEFLMSSPAATAASPVATPV